MNNTFFHDMIADSGAAIFAWNNANLDISQSQFIYNSVTKDGIITFTQSNMTMRSSSFD